MNVLRRRSYLRQNLLRFVSLEARPRSLIISSKNVLEKNLQTAKLSPTCPLNNYSLCRCKSKKQADPDSDDESEILDNNDVSLSRDSKVIKFNTTSLRTDAILKAALGVARNKIETIFYDSKIRVNGKKILKKSAPVRIDYEIDVIKSVSPKNPEHLYVSRIEIINLAAKEDAIVVTARRFKTLLIENYETDPYKPSTADEDK
ncbi:mitochondrial transcription rescue factor 1 [Danaus plexippus]|uniref:mitochondrial transcription rescue factor 1 n=1 Tax=Danaus plexippus TaxID=13037 RepID=UPI002AAF9666|nr:mitochondrial transcription rescue factor 1 [Danaus plexippus]